jgi:hypothetical protein
MPFDAPFMLGPFSVDAAGRLAPGSPTAMPAFLFRWRGRVVRARLGAAGPGRGRLMLRCIPGRVPSTARVVKGVREQGFAALHWLRADLPPRWALGLLPDHRVLLEAQADIAVPITAIGLVAELVGFVLALAPYLELLEELGVAPTGASEAGTANT